MSDSPLVKTIAVLGGTGKEGSALARRWALNGYRVIIGSRTAEKAQQTAAKLNAEIGDEYILGMDNPSAASEASLVVLTVPYNAHRSTLEQVKAHLAGKVLVDVTVPITPPNIMAVTVPEGLSAAQEAQAFLGDQVKVISAYQNVSSIKINDPDAAVYCDVLVTGDDEDAKQDVMQLVESSGMKAIDAGPLANAVAAEALTPVLLYINKKYGVKGAGIRITGLDK